MRKTAAAVGIAVACIMAPASSAMADTYDTRNHSVAAQPSPSPGGGKSGGGMGGLWGLLGLGGLLGLIPRKGAKGQRPSEYVSSGTGRGEHRGGQGGRDRGDIP
jgi:hypothetical protein